MSPRAQRCHPCQGPPESATEGAAQRGALPHAGRLAQGTRRPAGSGFSVFVGRPVATHDQAGLERPARYARRPHLADSKITYVERTDRVVYCSGKSPHPGFKANYRVFDAVDFVAAVCGFLPSTFQHEDLSQAPPSWD
ncbi:transposase [Planctomycetota bacterium]